jgi:ribosomal protein L5
LIKDASINEENTYRAAQQLQRIQEEKQFEEYAQEMIKNWENSGRVVDNTMVKSIQKLKGIPASQIKDIDIQTSSFSRLGFVHYPYELDI